MQKHEIKRKSKRIKHVQIGRGGKRGKTSGKGHKGQKARAGAKIRPEIRDMIKKLPKLRGRGKNLNTSIKDKNVAINVAVLEANFKSGEKVTTQILFEKGLIRKIKGSLPSVKIVGKEEVKTKLIINEIKISEGAKKSIEAAGGEIK